MPAATTHVEMAKEVYALSAYLQSHITDKQMFYLGSQGPDLLFFNRASILPGSTKKYGNLMHVAKVKEVIHYFEDYSKNDPLLRSYFLGYLCHYCLDSIAHPLIYGVAHALHTESGPSEGEIHVTLESAIDLHILKKKGRNASSYNVYEDLRQDPKNVAKLAKMYRNMFHAIFDISLTQKHLERAIKDVAFFTKVLKPHQTKYKIFYAFENTCLKGSHAITGMMLQGEKNYCVLNTEHAAYTLPWDENETVSASFDELYAQAIQKALRIVEHRSDADFAMNFCGTDKPFQDE